MNNPPIIKDCDANIAAAKAAKEAGINTDDFEDDEEEEEDDDSGQSPCHHR
jgi:hypothetical protein